jgi:hypothetical protein
MRRVGTSEDAYVTQKWQALRVGRCFITLIRDKLTVPSDGRVFSNGSGRSRIPAFALPRRGFYERAQAIQAERAEDERRRRQWEEEGRQRKERQERRAAHAKLISDLERQAGAWHRSRILRRYIQAARRALGAGRVQVPFRDQSIDFLDWATAYVDQIDPLSASPLQSRSEPRAHRLSSDE